MRYMRYIRLLKNPNKTNRSLQYWLRTRDYHGESRFDEIINDPETKAILVEYCVLAMRKEITIAEAVRFADFDIAITKINLK
jgi:hypothetical protein